MCMHLVATYHCLTGVSHDVTCVTCSESSQMMAIATASQVCPFTSKVRHAKDVGLHLAKASLDLQLLRNRACLRVHRMVIAA